MDDMRQNMMMPKQIGEFVVLHLPKPPTINHYYGQARNGRRFIKPEGEIYRKEVIKEVDMAGCNRLYGDLFFQVCYYPPDKRKRDLDNILKALQDAITKSGLIEDDSQIKWNLSIMMKEIIPGGIAYVTIGELK